MRDSFDLKENYKEIVEILGGGIITKACFNAGSVVHISNASSMWASFSNGILGSSSVTLRLSSVDFILLALI